MLSIRAAKGADYYERAEFARDDYYGERGQVRGTWEGAGARSLGLSGGAVEGRLGDLLDGRDPTTGHELAGTARRRGGNVAFDLVFAAPKGVSVLAAVGDEDTRRAVLAAHAAGVRAGLDYLERRACFVRRGRNGVTLHRGRGFVAAMYLHEMARSGDPHLHAHLVIANRVLGPDGRWSAPDMRPVYAEAKTAGIIAEAVTRDALTRSLGVEWGPVRNGTADLIGVPREVAEEFSRRHAEIVEEAAVRGYSSPAALSVIQRETRDRKRVVARTRAVAEWRARAAEHGFGERELRAALGRARPPSRARLERVTARARAAMLEPAGLTRRAATFTRREVIQSLAEALSAGAPPGAIERDADDFLASSCVPIAAELVDGGRGHREPLYTTPDMLRVEARLLQTLAGEDPCGPLVAHPGELERAIARRPMLGGDQVLAVRHLCGGRGRVRILEARAGTGKTYALQAVREAYEASGVPVVGTAWQGQAADVLAREAGIPSQTTALLLERAARGEEAIPAGAVVVCDEASAMPTRALDRLASLVSARAGRLILVGDRAQLPAVDAAGAFAALADRLGSVELRENRRQRTELQRRVAERLAEGAAAEAIALLCEHGRLGSYSDARDARNALIASWARRHADEAATALILAHDRREVALLNAMARSALDDAGHLGSRRITAAGREWATGDRLVCRRNDYRLDVRNGTRGTVVEVDADRHALSVCLDDGRDVRLPPGYLRHVEHGYALTGHTSQGATVDRTYLLATPERGGREWAYVAASRQRIDLEVFAVHHDQDRLRDALERAWSRSQAKSLAIDLAVPEERTRALRAAEVDVVGAPPEVLIRRSERLRAELAAPQQSLARSGSQVDVARRVDLEAAVARQRAQIVAAEGRLDGLIQQRRATNRWRASRRSLLRAEIETCRGQLASHWMELLDGERELASLELHLKERPSLQNRKVRTRQIVRELVQVRARVRRWSTAAEVAHPSAATTPALGSRPTSHGERVACGRPASSSAAHLRRDDIAPDPPALIGLEYPVAEGARAWNSAGHLAREGPALLGRPTEWDELRQTGDGLARDR